MTAFPMQTILFHWINVSSSRTRQPTSTWKWNFTEPLLSHWNVFLSHRIEIDSNANICEENSVKNKRRMHTNTTSPVERICNGIAPRSSTLNWSCFFRSLKKKTSFGCSRAVCRCVAQRHCVPNNRYTRTELVKLFSFRRTHHTETNWCPTTHNC